MKMKKDHRDIGKIGWEHMENNKHSSMNFNTKKLTGFFIMLVCMTYIVYSLNIFLLGNYSCAHCMACRGNCTEKKAEIIVVPNVTRSFPRKNANVTFVLQQKGNRSENTTTDLGHIVFGIAASAKLWNRRKDYLRIWWRSNEMRGYVWLDTDVLSGKNDDKNDNSTFPPIMISQGTTKFQYTNRQGHRSALRISRIVSETFRLGLPDVHWFVMGDDDTVFVTDNLVRVLSKYDHREMYYIGSLSESHLQNIHFSYNMAYGGGGFAISYPLAKALEKMQDGCIQRYPGLYGSDDRIQACMAELGVPLTKELGFHQCDIYGNLLGLLTAHPVTPLVSLHHLDVVEPIFPKGTRVQAMQHLFKAIELDSAGVLQQSICYDQRRQWSISISWGYAVQIYRGIFRPRDLEMPSRTFLNWYRRADYTAYAFNTRPVTRHPCQKPFLFFRKGIHYNTQKDTLTSNYTRHDIKPPKCRWRMASPESIEWIQVIKKHQNYSISQAPRRNCCRVLSSKQTNIKIQVSYCKEGEIIAI